MHSHHRLLHSVCLPRTPRCNSQFIPSQYLAHSHHHRPARSPTRCALRGVPLRLSYEVCPSVCLTRCAPPSALRGVPLRLSYEVCPSVCLTRCAPPSVLRGVPLHLSYVVLLSMSFSWCTSASLCRTFQYLAHSHHLSTVQSACLPMRVCCSTSSRNRAVVN